MRISMPLCLLVIAIFSTAAACNGTGTGSDVSTDTAGVDTQVKPGDTTPPNDGGVDTTLVDTKGGDTTAADTTLKDTQPPADTSESDTADSDATTNPGEGKACPGNERVGYFEVANWDFYASVAGQIYDGVIPLEVLQPKEEAGGCILMQKKNPFCDPPCGAGELCNHDNSCAAYPAAQSVGTVTVTGLKTEVVMEPKVTKAYAETNVPFPLFDSGAAIELTAVGGDLAGFVLKGTGVASLEVPADVLTVEKDKDLVINWSAADGPGRMYMRVNVDQHGNSPVTMVCDVEDDGQHTIPSGIITNLLEYGVSGFATFDLYRRTVDSTWLEPGCVELRIFSYMQGKLMVEGHVPCFTDMDCSDGEVCKVAINTCVGE